MTINSKIYDVLKWIGTIVLPALSVLIVSLGDVWGMPYVNEISQTIIALDVFLNALLGISSANYYKTIATGNDVVEGNTEDKG